MFSTNASKFGGFNFDFNHGLFKNLSSYLPTFDFDNHRNNSSANKLHFTYCSANYLTSIQGGVFFSHKLLFAKTWSI